MVKVIKLSDLIGTDIRSRSNASILRKEIDSSDTRCVNVDFSDIVFLSRSVADEFINISEAYHDKEVHFTGLHGFPKNMLDIVYKSRKQKRTRHSESQEITMLSDMESLKEYFATF